MKKRIVFLGLIAAISVSVTGCGQTTGQTSEAGKTPVAEENTRESETADDSGISKFVGDWYVDGSLENGHLEIDANGHVTSYSFEDTVNYEGELKREEYENPDQYL